MKIPFKYILRNLWTRRLTTSLTILGIALVVFVFAAVLMMAYGIQKTLIETGSDDNVIILRKAATAEITSIIMLEQANIIRTLPQIARGEDGKPVLSNEIVAIINMAYRKDNSGLSNVTVRGVTPEGQALRPQIKMVDGRMFQWGSREIIIGSAVAKNFIGTETGNTIKFGGDTWTIVGRFDAGGSGFDSEIWGDIDQLSQAFGYTGAFSSILIRTNRNDAYDGIRDALERDLRLQTLVVKKEKQFYQEQSEDMAMFIRIVGIAVTVIFSLGSMIGAMITMYAAVSNRTTEIGTLRALGFKRRSVLTAFLVESLFLSVLGGILGLMMAFFLQFFSISMMNFGSFTEIAFSFALSPAIVIISLFFSLLMGMFGGFLPAIRAARLNIVSALRAS